MRYADGPEAEVSVDIAAPPSVVWDLVIDINLPARFSDEFTGAEWLDQGTPALGARFLGHNDNGQSQWDTTCTVVEFEQGKVFAYAVEDVDDPAATWRYSIEPTAVGTRLTMWAQMGPGRSGVSYIIHKNPDREGEIVARRLEMWLTNMNATVAGIKSLAEEATG